MDGSGESPKEAAGNAEMLLALLSHSEELRKGNRSAEPSVIRCFCGFSVAGLFVYSGCGLSRV